MEAYQGLLPPDTVPAYFMYMTADPATIDVNIHPTKTEIKFEDETSVWQIMLASVREALGRFNVVPSLDFGPEGAVEIPVITGNTPPPPSPHIEVDHTFNPFDGTEYNRPETKWKWDAERQPATRLGVALHNHRPQRRTGQQGAGPAEKRTGRRRGSAGQSQGEEGQHRTATLLPG